MKAVTREAKIIIKKYSRIYLNMIIVCFFKKYIFIYLYVIL